MSTQSASLLRGLVLILMAVGPALSQPKLNIGGVSTLPPAQVGVDYSYTLQVTGRKAPYTWAVISGALPAGLNLSASSGTISGRPTAAGSSSFRIGVTDADRDTDFKNYTLTTAAAAVPPPAITTTTLPAGMAGTSYTQSLSASGGTTPYTWSVTAGALPSGLTLSSGGVISGTPTVAGTFNFTATVTDSANLSNSKALQITIGAAPVPPSITTGALPAGTAGTSYTQSLSASGGTTPYTWSVTAGALPAGVTLSSGGVISGTPTAAGAFDFTARVTDAANLSGSKSLRISINVAPTPPLITTSSLPPGTTGVGYSGSLSASGGILPYSWTVSAGVLPPGLILTANGALSGTPTVADSYDFTAKVTDAANLSDTRSLRITISATASPPSITLTPLPSGTVGTRYSQSLSATGGTLPYSWSIAAGTLPPGVELSNGGLISGVPTTAGAYDSTVKVTDASNLQDSKPIRITISAAPTPPSITTSTLAAGTAGASYTQTLSASGGTGPYTWSVAAGTLPPGVNLSGAGILSGTPTTSGAFDFSAKVTDSANLSDSKPLRVTINPAPSGPAITTNSLPEATAGSGYAVTATASGGQAPYTWSVSSGALPPGLTLQSSTGQVSGIPSVPGNFSFSLRVSDAAGRTAEKSLTIVVTQKLFISACPAGDGLTRSPYSSNLAALGGTPPYTWSISGQLPLGLALDSASGTLSGTPLVPGTFAFEVQVSDGNQSASRACTILITSPLTILTPSLPDAATLTNYAQTVSATGGSLPYRWTTSAGSLPPGLTLDEISGKISGVPSQTGRFAFTVTVTDSLGKQAQRAYPITVGAGLSIPACPFPTAAVGQSYTSALAAIGGQGSYSWGVTAGSLPSGLIIAADTGVISGTPITSGVAPFVLQTRDGGGATITRQCSIAVAPELIITSSSLATGSTGVPYSDTISATGGTLPYTWILSGDALPPGVTLNAATGGISGLPVQTGTFRFTVKLTDAAGIVIEKPLVVTVGAGFNISACPSPSGTLGQSYSSALSIAGGGPGVVWAIAAGVLPSGLTLDSASGTVAGTPVNIGNSDFIVSANGGGSASATRACSINISAPGINIITSPVLTNSVMGSAYDQKLTAAGGRSPYTWSVADGSLPPGLTLGDGGNLAGAPTAVGTYQFTAKVVDQDNASATQSFKLSALPAAPPGISFDGLPDIVAAAQQPQISFALDNGYPMALKGRLIMQFTPDPNVGVDDRAVSFVTGGRTVAFDVPANTTHPVFPVPQLALQTGTVAGTIQLSVQLTAGDLDITPPIPPRTMRIDRTSPVIANVKITPVADGFEVAVTGFSSTREVFAATFQFTAAADSRLESSEVTVLTADASRAWYRDPRSIDYGSQFIFVQPFTLRGATLSEVSVTLTNGQGTSQPARMRF